MPRPQFNSLGIRILRPANQVVKNKLTTTCHRHLRTSSLVRLLENQRRGCVSSPVIPIFPESVPIRIRRDDFWTYLWSFAFLEPGVGVGGVSQFKRDKFCIASQSSRVRSDVFCCSNWLTPRPPDVASSQTMRACFGLDTPWCPLHLENPIALDSKCHHSRGKGEDGEEDFRQPAR